MVAIVLVSHSTRIAEGTLELIKQMTGEKIRIETAAGTSDNRLGTDVALIEEKIRKVSDRDGVLIMADLGSAIISAEMALEALDEQLKNRTLIADAPFVEGAVAAAMEASFGKSLIEVKEAAENTRDMRKIV
jgi:dihydroxyacetone kinase phosphotransfer subunit